METQILPGFPSLNRGGDHARGRGRIQRQVRTAFGMTGQSTLSTTELLPWTHSRLQLVRAPVRRVGIAYELATKHKSELYADPFLGMLIAQRIDLPRNERAINQICSLERSVQRSGRDQITHPTHGHDDVANAIAGVVEVARSASTYRLDVPSASHRCPENSDRTGTRSRGGSIFSPACFFFSSSFSASS
jgi:hypothetical protein